MHLRNWWSQILQIWCTGWMCKSQPTDDMRLSRTVFVILLLTVRSCDPLQNFGAPVISLERLNLKSSNFVHNSQYQFCATGWHITNKRAWLWSCDCLKILPFVAPLCQRQLSYLLTLESIRSLSPELNVPCKKGTYPNFRQHPMSDIAY